MKTKVLTMFILIFIIGIVAYLDSPYSILNKNYSFTADEPVMAKPLEPFSSTDSPNIQEKLVKKEKVGGYIIETYREYEIYKDKEGHITKSIPTSNFNELKYWDYKKK